MPGGANWNNPTTTRNYATEVLPDIKTRDEDALTLLGGTAPTNIPVGAIKYNRANEQLQEWDGAAFVTKKWAVLSGGTGATDAAGARTNLGIGTLGTQNSNAISVTGGSITGLTAFSTSGDGTISGKLAVNSSAADALDVAGGIKAGSGNVGIIGTDGRIPALTSTYFADLSALAPSVIFPGAIIMSDTACPAGWTRVAALDSRFPVGWTVYGATGGTISHSHVVASHTHSMPAGTAAANTDHTHAYSGNTGIESSDMLKGLVNGGDANNFPNVSHTHAYSGNTGAMSANASHSHTIGGSSGAATPGTDTVVHVPPYLQVIFCRKD